MSQTTSSISFPPGCWGTIIAQLPHWATVYPDPNDKTIAVGGILQVVKVTKSGWILTHPGFRGGKLKVASMLATQVPDFVNT